MLNFSPYWREKLAMPGHKTEGIVIHSADFGESDKLVTFFTKHFGKLKGIAKSAKKSKKRFAGTLEIFSHVNINFFEKENLSLARIESCSLIDSFSKIHDSLERVTYGSYFVELVNEMVGEREKNRRIFNLLFYFLRLLNGRNVSEELLRIYEIRLLTLLGYQPQLDQCIICQGDIATEIHNWFSLKKGGVVCPRCHRGIEDLPISLGTSLILKTARSYPLSKITRVKFTTQALKESRQILSNFVEYQLGKRLKSLQFLEQMKGI
jgi:DNA repair protein RecO (recombination protein O)